MKSIAPRSIDEMAQDIYVALKSSGLSKQAKEAIIRDITSMKTALSGKYVGHHLWSEKAIQQYKILLAQQTSIEWGKWFVHEHVVPQSILVEIFLLWAPYITLSTITVYLRWILTAVVILKQEDRHLTQLKLRNEMPDDWWDPESDDYQNHWIRYTRSGISVHKCTWNKKILVNHQEISYDVYDSLA